MDRSAKKRKDAPAGSPEGREAKRQNTTVSIARFIQDETALQCGCMQKRAGGDCDTYTSGAGPDVDD